MPNSLLILVSVLALLVQIIFDLTSMPPIKAVVGVVVINSIMAALFYAAMWRRQGYGLMLRGLARSTRAGLLEILITGVLFAIISFVSDQYLRPLFDNTTPSNDWTTFFTMWPVIVFCEASNLLFKRWGARKEGLKPPVSSSA